MISRTLQSELTESRQTLFPILYLVLKRDLEKVSLARKHVLADSELPDAVETIQYITEAAMYRVSDLRGERWPHNLSPQFT